MPPPRVRARKPIPGGVGILALSECMSMLDRLGLLGKREGEGAQIPLKVPLSHAGVQA